MQQDSVKWSMCALVKRKNPGVSLTEIIHPEETNICYLTLSPKPVDFTYLGTIFMGFFTPVQYE